MHLYIYTILNQCFRSFIDWETRKYFFPFFCSTSSFWIVGFFPTFEALNTVIVRDSI